MNNINRILKKFCDTFALELCRIEQSNFVDYHLYITTIPKETHPFIIITFQIPISIL